MTGPYCEECEGRPEGLENARHGSAPSSAEKGGATEGSEFAEERDKVEAENDRRELV